MSGTDRTSTHVGEERMQALLDGGLGDPEARAVQEHVSSCARCRSELATWTALYRGLETLPELAPSPGFVGRVLDAVPEPSPAAPSLAARLLAGLRRGGGEPVAGPGHLDARSIQELLDRGMAPSGMAAAEAHLAGCRSCREDVEGWRGLVVRLDELPHLAPSPDFRERVMAHVRVRTAAAMARPGLRERLGAWLALNPGTGRRLAGLAGAAVTPAAIVALVAWTVLSHPLVTPGTLSSFLLLKARSVASDLAGGIWARVAESGLAPALQTLVEPLTRSAGAAAATATLLGGLTVAAAWVLYRNVIAATPAENRYARVPF